MIVLDRLALRLVSRKLSERIHRQLFLRKIEIGSQVFGSVLGKIGACLHQELCWKNR